MAEVQFSMNKFAKIGNAQGVPMPFWRKFGFKAT